MVGRLVGRYLVVKTLAAGGFGTVHLAVQHTMPSKKAAVKVLHPQDDPAMLELFLRKFKAEAEALAVVSHPNVVQLLDFGTQDDAPYMVMEFVEGARTLADEIRGRLRHGRGFSPGEIRSLLEQTANGLDAAHAKGITHRDIKPENLMLQSVAGNPMLVRIVDFGLARFEEHGTRTSKAMGTPTYMAPEQLALREVGPWTDLYALGVVAHELMTGRLPFSGRTAQEVFAKKISPTYDPLAELNDLHLPRMVEAFLRRSLARDPGNRYRTCSQFKAGLVDACRELEAAGPRYAASLDAPSASQTSVGESQATRLAEAPPRTGTLQPTEPRNASQQPATRGPARVSVEPLLRVETSSGRRRSWLPMLILAVGLVVAPLLLVPRLAQRPAQPDNQAPASQPATRELPEAPAAPADGAPAAPAKASAAACEPDCEARV
jgi:serine/threonine-protein kinase